MGWGRGGGDWGRGDDWCGGGRGLGGVGWVVGSGGSGVGAVEIGVGGLKFLESALYSGQYIWLKFHQNRSYFNFQVAEPPIRGPYNNRKKLKLWESALLTLSRPLDVPIRPRTR